MIGFHTVRHKLEQEDAIKRERTAQSQNRAQSTEMLQRSHCASANKPWPAPARTTIAAQASECQGHPTYTCMCYCDPTIVQYTATELN
jgi:hypothetical protein